MRSKWTGAALAGGLLLFTLAVYGRLPETLPSHWNARGEVDGWMARWPGALLPAAMVLGLWALALVLPRIDPRRSQYDRFQETYWLLMNLTLLFLALVGVATLGAGLGWAVDVGRLVPAGVGILLVGMGNYLPRVKSNWWMGIRTPWTLSSEEVWRRTHRMGGRLFVAAGLVILLSVLLPPEPRMAVVVGTALVAAFGPMAYSYLVWRRER